MRRHKAPTACRVSARGITLFLFSAAIVCAFSVINGLRRVTVDGPSTADRVLTTRRQRLKKPLLKDYVQGWNITNNVSWLLDFAIIGFPKTGTSTLMLYLKNQTHNAFIFEDERCEIGYNQQARLLKNLYKQYDPNVPRRLGIKCPRDLENPVALNNYDAYFQSTKFIVGLRHPVLLFESLYNHRVQNEYPMPPPQRLVGGCKRVNQGVCTNRANFAQHLRKVAMPRQVFVYDVTQLRDDNVTRATQFRKDLGKFLDLRLPLNDPMIWVKPGRSPMSVEHAAQLDSLKMDICSPENTALRQLLMNHASDSATWLTQEFLKQKSVTVSSPEYFSTIMETWHHDPCEFRIDSQRIK